MSSAIAISRHSGISLICNQFGAIAIATEAPPVAIVEQIRCKRVHAPCTVARVCEGVFLLGSQDALL